MSNSNDVFDKTEHAHHRVVRSALFILLWMTVFSVVVPFSPVMPAAGLDSSWALGMNQAMKQGLQFGKDLIFTYGPYSFIETHSYTPTTDLLMILTCMSLAFALCILVFHLFRQSRWHVLVALIVMLAGNLYQLAALLYFYQLLAGAYCLRHVGCSEQQGSDSMFKYGLLAIVFIPLGLLPLVKGALLPSSMLVIVISIFYCLSVKEYKSMCVILITAIVSPVLFWRLSGQEINNLTAYYHYVLLFASGYTEAMSWGVLDHVWEIIPYLISSVFLLLVVVLRERNSLRKLSLILLLSGFLYLIFKAGFVRHDPHVRIATGFLLFAAILVYVLYGGAGIRLYGLIDISAFVLLLIFSAVLYVSSSYQEVSLGSVSRSAMLTYASTWQGVATRIFDAHKLEVTYASKMQEANRVNSYPKMQGTTDVYSVNQAGLIASGNAWNPRPVFQSYAAYTPELMQINQRHLMGSHAPDNIIFMVEPIDRRLPSLEDSLSWPVIWSRYELYGYSRGNWVHLKKRAADASITMGGTIREMHRFGEAVRVPNSMDATFVKIIMRRSLLGRLSNFMYKTSTLVILTKTADGAVQLNRLIPEMAEAGFLVSPLIQSTSDFAQMYASGHPLANKKVVEFMICGTEGKTVTTKNTQWNSEMEVIFTEADMSKVATKEQVYSYD